MANYTGELTEKQKAALEPLERQFKSFERKINKLKQETALDIGIDYDAKKRRERQINDFKLEQDKVSKKISDVYAAKEKYDGLISFVKTALDEAEQLDELYGPWPKEA